MAILNVVTSSKLICDPYHTDKLRNLLAKIKNVEVGSRSYDLSGQFYLIDIFDQFTSPSRTKT